jgi:DNA-binding XRE family transcriptional regulator
MIAPKLIKEGGKMSSYIARNRKIALVRGNNWKESLIKGKLNMNKKSTLMAELRVGRGLSQNAIANLLQISLASYGAIERGKGIKKIMANYLADFFKRETSELFNYRNGRFFVKNGEGEF